MSEPLPGGTHLAYVVCDSRRHWSGRFREDFSPVTATDRPRVQVLASPEIGADDGCADGYGDDYNFVAWSFFVVEYDMGFDPRWEDDDQREGGPQLRVMMFADAWPAFVQIPEFFAALGTGGVANRPHRKSRLRSEQTRFGLGLDGVVALLDSLGAVDETERWGRGRG